MTDTSNHLENLSEPNVRVILYITDTMARRNNEMGQLVDDEMQKAHLRGDTESFHNMLKVTRYLTEEALSWHAGRDIATLEETDGNH